MMGRIPIHLRLWVYFGLMLVAGTVILAGLEGTLDPLLLARPFLLGQALGGAAAVMIIPAIVVIPWRLIELRWRATGTPLLVGALIWAASLALIMMGMATHP